MVDSSSKEGCIFSKQQEENNISLDKIYYLWFIFWMDLYLVHNGLTAWGSEEGNKAQQTKPKAIYLKVEYRNQPNCISKKE